MIDKCIHVAKKERDPHIRITPESTGASFELCTECFEIWNGDRRSNPAESVGYFVYRSTDPDLPKDQWVRLNDKPIPPTRDGKMEYVDKTTIPGAVYYVYIVGVSGIGIVGYPSEVIKLGEENEEIYIDWRF